MSFSYDNEKEEMILLYPVGTNEEDTMAAFKQIGNVVILGSYEQDNNLDNGKEPIEWIVLDVQNGKSMLITKYMIELKNYYPQQKRDWDKFVPTWEKSDLRNWLNKDFYNLAFTNNEQNVILDTKVDNSKKQGNSEARHGYRYISIEDGINTTDKIFILSYAEAWHYLDTKGRAGEYTDYAGYLSMLDSVENYDSTDMRIRKEGSWLLRSPGESSRTLLWVWYNGELTQSAISTMAGIRPALWVDLSKSIY